MPGRADATLPDSHVRRACPAADLQRAMSRYASVVRDGEGLERLAKELDTAMPRVLKSRATSKMSH